jgi:hypothetical protein
MAAFRRDSWKRISQNQNVDEIPYGKLRSFLVANMTLNVPEAISCTMGERSIALYFAMKGLSAKAIYQGFVQTLGAEAVAYPTVTWYLRAARFPAQSTEGPDEAGGKRTHQVGAAVLKALTDNSFSSVRELSGLSCLSRSTVHRRLTESLGFTIRYLHWIPHRLSDDQG